MAFLQLLVLVSVMFLSTFIIGSLPLSLSAALAPARFHQVSIFSIGLLIGAALTIVIPEGIDTIYSSTPPQDFHDPHPSHHHHSAVGLALMAGFLLMFLIDQIARSSPLKNSSTTSTQGRTPSRSSSSRPVVKVPPSAQTAGLLAPDSWPEDGLMVHWALLLPRRRRSEKTMNGTKDMR